MTFDKEALLKNRFWVLLAGVVPLVIIAIIILVTVVTASIAADKKALEDANKGAQGPFSDPKNPKHIKAMKETADAFQARQDEVWKQVYLPQKNITEGIKAWPKSFNDIFRYHDGLFAKRVQVYTKQAAPQPPEGKAYFLGKATVVDRDYIVVHGTGSDFKTPDDVRFNRSADVKVAMVDENNAAKNFFEIPLQSNVVVFYQKAKYFNDALTDTERERYARHYFEPIPLIIEQVEPVNEKGEGVVQFKDWLPRKSDLAPLVPPAGAPFLPFVAKGWLDELKNDFSADAWIAQEDLWISREIYRLVRLSNDYVSRFIHDGGDGVQSPYICSNPYWKLEMQLKNDDLIVKATNNTTRRQSMDVYFWINFNNKNAAEETKNLSAGEWAEYRSRNFEKVLLGGEPVNPSTFADNFREVKVTLPPGLPRSQIFSVEQVLNWKTAAVKRIDVVDIGAHSHRTIVKGLKPLKDEKAALQAAPLDPNQPQLLQPQTKVNVFGLRTERYSEVTPQARRVPVAVSLIVDQQHTNRVLAAFANSDLRLVITQILQNNYEKSVRPQVINVNVKGPIIGGQPFQPPGPGAQPISEEQEANVELTVYGILSIYERHPPREPEAAEAVPVAPPMP